jgi:valyl-tRNA synthetase
VNKLWNASRFIMMNLKGNRELVEKRFLASPVDLPSRWILSRLSVVADEVNRALEEYRFNDAASSIYQFIWHEFCDWYIEMAKIELSNRRQKPGEVVSPPRPRCFLRLLHPFMPYITEEIWQMLKKFRAGYCKPGNRRQKASCLPRTEIAAEGCRQKKR